MAQKELFQSQWIHDHAETATREGCNN